MSSEDEVTRWLGWVLPISIVIGAALVVIRKLLTQQISDEVFRMLEQKHEENLAQFKQLKEVLEEDRKERILLHQRITILSEQMAFMRGVRSRGGDDDEPKSR